MAPLSADSNGRPWDWSEDADDIVVKAQPAVAVYPGPSGIVIRRQGDWNDDDDEVIWFGVDQALAVAAAILKAAGLDIADLVPEPGQARVKPRDATGAERQRRRRTRQKQEKTAALFDCDVTDGVTPEDRDAVTDTVTRDGEAA